MNLFKHITVTTSRSSLNSSGFVQELVDMFFFYIAQCVVFKYNLPFHLHKSIWQ